MSALLKRMLALALLVAPAASGSRTMRRSMLKGCP